jgi:hypothetical protein
MKIDGIETGALLSKVVQPEVQVKLSLPKIEGTFMQSAHIALSKKSDASVKRDLWF